MSPRFPRTTTRRTAPGTIRRLVAATGLATLLAAAAAGSTFAADADVSMVDFDFEPQSVTIDVGDSVTWMNDGDIPHTATDAGEFDTGIVNAGASASVTFDEAGTFEYVCTLHPQMTGTVVVEAAGPSPTIGDPVSATPGLTPPAGTDTIEPVRSDANGMPMILVVLTIASGIAVAATLGLERRRSR